MAATRPTAAVVAHAAPASVIESAGACQHCGALRPTHRITLKQNVGAILIRFPKTVAGNLCTSCMSSLFWEMSLITLFAGWWGIVSFFVTPAYLLLNLAEYVNARRALPNGVGERRVATAADRGTGRPSRTLPALSLAFGLLGLVSLGALFPLSILGLIFGGVALFLAHGSSHKHGGRVLAACGIVASLIALSLPFWLLPRVLPRVLPPSSSRPSSGVTGSDAAAERELREADRRIMVFEGETAFGDTVAAKQMAVRMNLALDGLLKATGADERRGLDMAQGRCLTYVATREGRACFLVQIPLLRRYSEQTQRSLAGIAWRLARDIADDAYEGQDVTVGVGLRGMISYGAIAEGPIAQRQPAAIMVDAGPLPKRLLPYFQGPPASNLRPMAGETAAPPH